MTWEEVVAVAKTLPDVEDGSYHGFPALRVNGKFLTRRSDDGTNVVIKHVPFDEREMLIESEPQTFHLTSHYHAVDTVLARMASLDPAQFLGLIERRWRIVAPKAMVRALDAERPVP
jgi:hypothetical protein